MDEQVKARLIGATVLVVIAVLLVPELLSGPKHDAVGDAASAGRRGTRTFTIDLSGAVGAGSHVEEGPTGTSTEAQRSASKLPAPQAVDATLPRPGSAHAPEPEQPSEPSPQPAPAPAARNASAPETSPSTAGAAVREVTPGPAPAPAASRPVPAATGRWAVQVGAFGSVATARKLVADLAQDGLPAYVAPLQRAGKNLYRVRVGPVASRDEAQQLARRLESRRLPAAVVAAD
jgi:DedD protein